jgi:hypothetical protein
MIAGRIFATLIGTAIAIPALADTSAATPDFSGMCARYSFNFEAPSAGPGPIANLRRVGADASRPILGGDPVPLVGDYANPILTPYAAEIVRRMGEFSATGSGDSRSFPWPVVTVDFRETQTFVSVTGNGRF